MTTPDRIQAAAEKLEANCHRLAAEILRATQELEATGELPTSTLDHLNAARTSVTLAARYMRTLVVTHRVSRAWSENDERTGVIPLDRITDDAPTAHEENDNE